MNAKEHREEQRVLDLLDAVGKKNDLSQRHLARHMGVALGLANSYLRRCIRKGYIKISSAPANRYLYYLTPKGFTEKSRLTAKYLAASFTFYRQAGESCVKVLNQCELQGWSKILLCGVSDLAEIVALRALERNVEVVGTYDRHSDQRRFVALPVWSRLEEVSHFDACIVTNLSAPHDGYAELVAKVGRERVLMPDILRLE